MSNYTKGPWGFHRSGHIVTDDAGLTTAIICALNDEQLLANARLIAAAPELLEACKSLCDYWKENQSASSECWQFVDLLENAIAKAEGKS